MAMPRRIRWGESLHGAAYPLTAEQRQMAEAWIPACVRLSRDYEHKFNLQPGDLLADAWSACCHAASRFDPTRGFKFGSYVWPTLKRGLYRAARRQAEQRSSGCEWMDHDSAHRDAPPDEGPPSWLSLLSEREVQIVQMRADGFTLKQCGEKMGLSAGRINAIVAEVRFKVRIQLRRDQYERGD